jgi:hypothetical protein
MGRYYSGDIEGKFWFAIQSSCDADFFGSEGVMDSTGNYLDYAFEKEDLTDVKKGIDKCRKELGEYDRKLNTFFEMKDCYGDKELQEYLGLNLEKIRELLTLYARLQLGKEIYKCIRKKVRCLFTAEL